MARISSTGKCNLCGTSLDKSKMVGHMKSCLAKAPPGPADRPVFHLRVEGRYMPEYWLHLAVPGESTLGELDDFLRDTWLECCGHLSQFTIGQTNYMPDMDQELDGAESMDIRLDAVLAPGLEFAHEYDFGSTTALKLKVICLVQRTPADSGVEVLARNDPPAIPCGLCGKPAEEICMECSGEAEGWLCKQCAAKHKCDPDGFLPVVNSPRVGVCGYTGQSESEDDDDVEFAEGPEDEEIQSDQIPELRVARDQDRPPRKLKVDLQALLMAMEDNIREMNEYYLDTQTGEVVLLQEEIRSAIESGDEKQINRLPQWAKDEVLKTREVLADEASRFVEIPPIESDDAFEIMEDFVAGVEDDKVRQQLLDALGHRKPFRRFKDALADHAQLREQYFTFEAKRREQTARDWLEGEGIEAVP